MIVNGILTSEKLQGFHTFGFPLNWKVPVWVNYTDDSAIVGTLDEGCHTFSHEEEIINLIVYLIDALARC